MNKHLTSRIIIALDYKDQKEALDLVEKLDPIRCRLKIGKGMFTRYGPPFVRALVDQGFDVFLDLKFHDIPKQVALACQAAAELGVWMLNVHAIGGRDMLVAAQKSLTDFAGHRKPLLLGVTILTSLHEHDLMDIGLQGTVADNVVRLAKLCQHSKLDGVVCSAQEASLLRKAVGNDFCLVTPGIRIASDAQDDEGKEDQRRIMTPKAAIEQGADYLVIGRAITQSSDPMSAFESIEQSI